MWFRSYFSRRFCLACVLTLAAFGPHVAAQDPAPAELADRLRKMEETNQKLLDAFQNVAKQNEALSKQVQDLSKRLDDATSATSGASSAGADAPSAASPVGPENAATGGMGAGTGTSAIGGGNTSADIGTRGTRRGPDRTGLRGFYDQRYSNRYGYVLQSPDEEFEIRFNGLIQSDARIYNRTQFPVVSDIDIPRARIYLSGRMTKPIEYQISFQRSTNSLDILNAYFNFHYDDRLQLRVGRYRAPYTYEWAKLSIWELNTPDRSPFALNFGPNRQIGVMGWGSLFQDRLEYAVGIFDGARNSYQAFTNHKDVMSFVDYRPFVDQQDSLLRYLSVGGSLDAGRENNPLSPALLRSSTSGSTNTLTTGSGDSLIAVPFLAFNNNVREKGERMLYELHATYFYKGLSVLGAWDSGINAFSLTTPNARPVNLPVSGYFVQLAYILTGEELTKRALVEPLRPFDLRKGKFGPGAIEIQARFSELAVGKQVFTSGLADPNLWTSRLNLLDVGLNWYLTKNIKFYFDWERAFFADPVYYRPGAFQKTNDLYWLRLQLYF